jgi:hypothetical protein
MVSIALHIVLQGLHDPVERFTILAALGLIAYVVQGISRRWKPLARFVLTGCIGVVVTTIVMHMVWRLAAMLA